MITYIFMAICIAVFVYINYFSKDNKTSEAMHLGALYTPYVKNRGEYWSSSFALCRYKICKRTLCKCFFRFVWFGDYWIALF